MDSPEGEVYLALGGSGGSRIFGAVAQVILNLDWGFDLSNAVEQPRVHHQLLPAYVSDLRLLGSHPSSRHPDPTISLRRSQLNRATGPI